MERRGVTWYVPQTPLTEHVAMITAEDDDGVLVETALLENIEKLADAVVNVADGTIVGPTSSLYLLFTEVLIPQVADLEKPLAVGVLLLLGDLDLGKVDVYTFVEVPVFLLNGVGVVGVGERDLERGRSCQSWGFYRDTSLPGPFWKGWRSRI